MTRHRTDNLTTEPKLLKEYDKIISNYIQKGILEEVPIDFKTDRTHYLPHSAVVKENCKTTKICVAFDASTKYESKFSLNELLDPDSCLLPHV